QAVELALEPASMAPIKALAERLGAEAAAALAAQGAEPAHIAQRRELHLRYAGTEATLAVPLDAPDTAAAAFAAAHRARFGFATPGRALIVETVAVEAIAKGESIAEQSLPRRTDKKL